MISTAFSILGKIGAIGWYAMLQASQYNLTDPNNMDHDSRVIVRALDRQIARLGREISAEFDSIVRLDCLTPSKDVDLTEGLHPSWSPRGNALQHTPPGS